jgi:hypothetical protein
MNCPRCGASKPEGEHCLRCIVATLRRLEWQTRDVAASIARCTHPSVVTSGSSLWCPDCGAIRFRELEGWTLPEGSRYAKQVDDECTMWGRVHGPPPDDSDPKNVIRAKTST